MKRILGLLVILAALLVPAACGDDDGTGDGGRDPAGETTTRPTDDGSSGSGRPVVVDIVAGTAARGSVSDQATVIRDEKDLRRYLRQFRSEAFVADLTVAITGHSLAEDRVLGLAVLSIGCDTPPSATVTEENGRFLVVPGKVPDPLPECYAPVTSVAVLDLPA